jgi:alkanesulfonate monooxygenase SsuD/methylene tetrahydromethanopterin reductase-like flavin-dependent oxidoreductase (luciferase family)
MQEAHGGVLPHFTHNHDPFVALTYAAAATHTLRRGTGVCLVPQREPIATAKTLASLDTLSRGRLLCGVGVGWIPEEIANHGIDPPTRWAVMDERVHAMRAIWTQDEAEYQQLGARIRVLQHAASAAGRGADIPSPSRAPNPTLARSTSCARWA